MAKPLTAGEKIARDLCEMDAPIDNIIEVDPVDVARRIDEEVFPILGSLSDCAFRNERLGADYASLQEENNTLRHIHAENLVIKDAEIARLKTVPMKYRRMEFNAKLQAENAALRAEAAERREDHMKLVEENHELRQQLAASQLEAKRLRDALTAMVAYAREDGCGLKIADEALSSPTSTEALDAYVAEKVKEKTKALHYQMEHCYSIDHVKIQCDLNVVTKQRDLAVSELETVATGFDCDNDAHRYGTYCRKCEAEKALAAIKESEV